jgi:hypothetical protein
MLTQLAQTQALESWQVSTRKKIICGIGARTWQLIGDVTLKEIWIRITTAMVAQRAIK